MEIQGLSMLLDLKISLKKRLYRHVISQVERKIQRDSVFMSNRYFMFILLKQIEAVHGLLNEYLLGRFQKSAEKILKLFKIMNRNFGICLNAFKINMSKFMIHLNCPKKVSLVNENTMQIPKILNNFFPLLLRTCYYIQILEIIPQNTLEFIKSYKIILKKYFHQQNTLKIQNNRIISQNLLLIMMINIKHKNYQQSKKNFFEATTLIMQCLKILQKKLEKKKKTMKRQLFILLIIGVLNYQKMMIENNQVMGWDVGFQILKKIEKQFRLQQSAWGKHIRLDYQINQIIKLNNFQQIKSFILPYILQQSQIINNITNLNQSSIPYSTLHLQSEQKTFKRNNTHKKTYYSIRLNNKEISDTNGHINQKSILQQDRDKENNQLSKIKLSSKHKNILKTSKFPSIDCLQNYRPSEFLNNVFNDSIQEINRQDFTQSRHADKKGQGFLTLRSQNKIKQTKKIKRKNIRTIISNQTSAFVCNESIYDNAIKINKQFVKMKQKQFVINKLISQQRKIQFSKAEIQFLNLSKKKNINRSSQEQIMKKQKKQIEKSQMNIFMDILTKNKKILNINYLIDKYQLSKKRKKTRNYQLEILQIQIQKNLTDFFSFQCAKRNFMGRRNNVSLNSPSTNIKTGWKQDKIKKDQSIQKKLQNSHNKSKQVIKEMLKKISCSSSKSQSKIKKISMNSISDQTFGYKKSDFKQVYL